MRDEGDEIFPKGKSRLALSVYECHLSCHWITGLEQNQRTQGL